MESFVDDIDGSDAEGTTRFALDGTNYEIDLSGANRDKLEKVLGRVLSCDQIRRSTVLRSW
ncbi:histone-like nucleoid-structuring protein Lsr2 [Nonomuraea sp. NPDC049709]|uniref:Lsr2 dimerization domain-containing protein n=1 Tax=Nonomuraea sp. NPDC049709 TaxID=3154736 RepID=UPI00343F56A6